jgi:hypothetical protein
MCCENADSNSSARAAMARPSLFKPFKQTPSKQFYSSEQQNNPLKTAVFEFENLKSASTTLDTIVSLGTGLGIGTLASPAASDNRTISWTAAKRSVMGKAKQRPYERFDQECERTWNEWVESLPKSTPKDNYIRLNIDAYDLAALDDMEKAEGLRSMVGTQIRQKEFRVLACRLLARLLYFEKIGEVVALDNELFLRGT